MRRGAFFLFTWFLTACHQSPPIASKEFLKDSVVRRHLASIDSLYFYDTTNVDFQILRAYIDNDTVFFKELNLQMDREANYLYPPSLDSCVFPNKITDLPVDEAYRFIHSESFCNFGQAIAITRSNDSVRLYYAEYIVGNYDGQITEYTLVNGKHYTIGSNCVLLKEFNKPLHQKDWDLLEDRIDAADYWGLKPYNHRVVLDGSDWQVDAYNKTGRYRGGQQIHSVKRHSPTSVSFREIGIYLMKLSGEKNICGELR